MRGIGLTPETIKEIRSYVAAGEHAPEIARTMGLSLNTIYRHGGYNGKKQRTSDEVVERMKELQRQGKSHSEIAKETNVSWGTVQKYLGQQKTGCKADYGSLVTKAQDVANAPVIGETKQGGEEGFILEERIVSLNGRMFTYRISSKGLIKMKHRDGMNVDLNVESLHELMKELGHISNWLEKNCLKKVNTQDEWRK